MSENFKVSGKKFSLPASAAPWKFERRPGGWIIAVSPEGERRRFAMVSQTGKLSLNLSGRLYFGDLVEAQRHGSASSSGGGDSDLMAQFPGKVRKVLVQEGARVSEGDPMILVEAMKMEFTVKAPFAGTVTRVLVAEGQQLSPGDRFFELAAEEADGGNGG